ncbi:DEAD/DEAH box helicase [Neobacillus sp. OS1-32]|uniref:DEAD/DEAH box helicase n=1 Tax=Neobacillus sp. OS1-32 TaxID=3070682 RepID=UPI0027E15538|nr:DEAD/DEAH box helicase [Neobacillus sp. OS1-32]WML28714.1 DEAD/DEAH box helicase [Neobacillus sp. OS1-32]
MNIHLKPFLHEVWEKSEFQTMTAIQEAAIPVILEGRDVIAESPTGTGKTMAYLLPLLDKIDATLPSLQAVVIASSQELVMQIFHEFQKWSEGSGIRGTSIIGGANPKRQLEKLKKRPQVIFATPGRLLELIKQKKVKMHEVKLIVLDEGDQLLKQEHLQSVQNIVKAALADRQVVLFSATLNQAAEQLAKDLMEAPKIIRITNADSGVQSENVEHLYLVSERRDKIKLLEKMARFENAKSLAFINDIGELEVFKQKLHFKELSVGILHSEMKKLERQAVLKAFRAGDLKMLVATDVAARGLDIQGITHVVQIDLPRDITQYIHRAGRTGRMGANGTVISLVTEREERELKRYCRELNIPLHKRIIYKGELAPETVWR